MNLLDADVYKSRTCSTQNYIIFTAEHSQPVQNENNPKIYKRPALFLFTCRECTSRTDILTHIKIYSVLFIKSIRYQQQNQQHLFRLLKRPPEFGYIRCELCNVWISKQVVECPRGWPGGLRGWPGSIQHPLRASTLHFPQDFHSPSGLRTFSALLGQRRGHDNSK